MGNREAERGAKIMESKHLIFQLMGRTEEKTEVWRVVAKTGEVPLGQIRWFERWGKYCFFPSRQTVFDIDCMRDISGKIKELMARKKMGTRIKEE